MGTARSRRIVPSVSQEMPFVVASPRLRMDRDKLHTCIRSVKDILEAEWERRLRTRFYSASKRANPTERRGRKVTGLKSLVLHDRGIAEGGLLGCR